MASIYVDLAQPDTAIALCIRALKLDESYLPSYQTLGNAYLAKNDFESAARISRVGISIGRRLARNLFRAPVYDLADLYNCLGLAYSGLGRSEEAIQKYDSASSWVPNWVTPWMNKAKAYEAIHEWSLAERAYRAATNLTPGEPEPWRKLGQVCTKAGKYFDAVEAYRGAIGADSLDLDVHIELARLHLFLEEYEKAESVYIAASTLYPEHAGLYYWTGLVHFKRRSYSLALDFFQQALRRNEDYAEVHNSLGEVYELQGRMTEASKAFEKAATCDSTFALPWRNLGSLCLKDGRESEAIAHYRRAAMLGDESAKSFLRLRGIK